LCKSAQPTHIVNINLFLQAGLGVDDASQILERPTSCIEPLRMGVPTGN
jgi:hypothetical protein